MEHNIYQKLYAVVCGAASDAVDVLADPANSLYARCILIKALQDAEDYYLNATEDDSSPTETT